MSDATAAAAPVTFNPFEPGFFDDPYAQYRRLRELDPVHPSPFVPGVWLLFRYADVVRVLRDPETSVDLDNAGQTARSDLFRQALGDKFDDEHMDRGRHAILNIDPPDHTRLRRLVQKAFTPRMVENLRSRVQQLVDEMLDAVAPRGEMDLIADLAFPLPFTIISEMLGVPEGRRDELRAWSSALVRTIEPVLTPEEVHQVMDASDAMTEYVREVVAWKRREPGDDLLSGLIAAEEHGDVLSERELLDQVVLLYIAGHETTVNLIGNGVLALLRHRSQLERWRDDPALDARATDELLRYDSPVQFSRRITLRDIEISGKTIEAGTLVFTCLGSANHDPEEWGDDADTLDLDRADPTRHVSFGSGVHYCLGANLARVEGQVAISAIVRRFPRLELATDALRWNGRIVLRGPAALPLTF